MFYIIAGQTLIMFLLIIVGYIVFRSGLTDHHGNKALSDVLLMVVTPGMILDNMISVEYDSELMRGFFASIFLGFLSHIIGILVAQFAVRNDNNKNAGIERYCSAYENCGFIGLPIAQSLLGTEGAFYVTGYIISFNVLTWTHGFMEITGQFSLRKLVKGLLSPTVISIVIGLLVFVLRIPTPEAIKSTLDHIGNMNVPLGMIVAGTILGETRLLDIFKRHRIYLVIVLKLILMPVIVFAVMVFVIRPMRIPGVTDAVLISMLVPAACPVATNGMMFALRYGGDYKYASQMFVISTLISMLTIPVFMAVSMTLAGIYL